MNFLFISTNLSWGGSEILWFQSAEKLQKEGHHISLITFYESDKLTAFQNRIAARYQYQKLSEPIKILGLPLPIKKGTSIDQWTPFIQAQQPDAAIISQGNNVGSLNIAETLMKLEIPFMTLSQLVSESHFLRIDNGNLDRHRAVYSTSSLNCFVSSSNLKLHQKMVVYPEATNKLVKNPIINYAESPLPAPKKADFSIAFVARLECFHKGLDFLLEIASSTKWQERNLTFNLYGSGQHEGVVRHYIKEFNLKNIVIHGHNEGLKEIWTNNHLLFLPSRMEGQALSLLEAMWYGRGAVTTNIGGAEELIEDGVTGFLAPFADLNSIDEALERAWNLRDSWGLIGANAAQRIRQRYNTNPVDDFKELVKATFKKA